MSDQTPQPPSRMRQRWLPFASAGLGFLLGIGTGIAAFWLRVRYGAYDHYAYYGGLGQALSELLYFPAVGAFLGIVLGFNVGKAIVHR